MLYEIREKIIRLKKEGKRIIDFTVGDPDQYTDARIIDAATRSMKKGKTKYCSSLGETELREKIAKEYGLNSENVLISPGSKWAIFSVFYLLARGGNIVLPSPHWIAYELMAKELGIEVKILKRNQNTDWTIDASKIEELIDEKTRLIVLCNPDNPTSKSISEDTLRQISELADKKKVRILSDETYRDIAFLKIKTMADFGQSPEDIRRGKEWHEHVVIGSFSKTFAMTGWRIGYVVSDKKLIDEMARINQMTITSVPQFIQDAAIKALELKQEISETMASIYKKRAEMACSILENAGLRFSKPDAPFYLFVRCNADSEKLALGLLDKGIAIAPGSSFGDYNDYFRLSLTMPDEDIKTGIKKITEEVNNAITNAY